MDFKVLKWIASTASRFLIIILCIWVLIEVRKERSQTVINNRVIVYPEDTIKDTSYVNIRTDK